MQQRILPRGEIEGLEHTHIPRIMQAKERFLFQERASRLRQLAANNNSIEAYLLLMAHVADAQQKALADYKNIPSASLETIEQAQAHGMPPLQAVGWSRDSLWLEILTDILCHLQQEMLSEPVQMLIEEMLADVRNQPEVLEQLADAVLSRYEQGVDPARAPFVMAALQVYWARLAIDFDTKNLPVITPFGLCPCCGSLPVSTIVRIGGSRDGMRYATCGLCSTEWHIVRVTCTHCEDTEKIAYHHLEDHSEAIKAESCGKCNTYRKIFYQNKDQMVEAVADDLASLELDMLMGEEGFFRVNDNPLLWHQSNE